MSNTSNEQKPIISKKWLYGALAVIALALGLFLDGDAIAATSNSVTDTSGAVEITKEDGEIDIESSVDNKIVDERYQDYDETDGDAYDYTDDDVMEDED